MISIDYMVLVVILNFLLMLIVLKKILYVPIRNFLSERQQRIAEDIDNAKKSRDEAAQLVEQRQDELKNSSEEIRGLKALAKKEADQQALDIIKQAKKQEKSIIQQTEKRLEQEQKEAIVALEGELKGMVASLTQRLLEEKLSVDLDQKVIDRMIARRTGK